MVDDVYCDRIGGSELVILDIVYWRKIMKKDFMQGLMQYAMILAMVVGAYLVGVYKTKVEYLENGSTTQQTTQVAGDTAQQPTKPTTVDAEQIKKDIFDGNHVTFGDKNAAISFVEISDPSCPYCHIAGGEDPELNAQVGAQFTMEADGGSYVPAVPEMRKLVDEGKASFAWVYTPGHGNGELGTQAMYCAYEVGKFWEVHDLLMSDPGYAMLNETVKNDVKKASVLAEFLKGAMDPGKLTSCLESEKYKARLTDESSWVQQLGFGATPTFFVNDQVVEGAASWDTAFAPIVEPLL